MSPILPNVPLLFKLTLQGEAIGMTEQELQFVLDTELSLSCRLGTLMKARTVQFGVAKIEGLRA